MTSLTAATDEYEAMMRKLQGRTFMVKRSNGNVEDGWRLSHDAGFGDVHGDLEPGEVMCISPDEATFRACSLRELIQFNDLHGAANLEYDEDEAPPPIPLKSSFTALLKPEPIVRGGNSLQQPPSTPPPTGTHLQHRVASAPRPATMKMQTVPFKDLTEFDTRAAAASAAAPQTDAAPTSPSSPPLIQRQYELLQRQFSDLQLMYNGLLHRYEQVENEYQSLQSSGAVSTTAVLGSMYMELETKYNELHSLYQHEVSLPLKDKNRELELELRGMDGRFAALQNEFRAQQSICGDVERALDEETRFRQQLTAQHNELQKQLTFARQGHSASQIKLEDAQMTIANLNTQLHHARVAAADLTSQVSQEHTRNVVLMRQLDSLVCRIEALPNVLPDVLESSGNDRSATPISKMSPGTRMHRHTDMTGAVRSIIGENIELATSLQTQIEMMQDTAKMLRAERLRVAALEHEIEGLKQQLEDSIESEQRALDSAQVSERDCNALIKDIRGKVADAWQVEEQKQMQMREDIAALKLEALEFASAKLLIIELQQLTSEQDELLDRSQNKHASEVEHLKLLNEEERVGLAQQHAEELKKAAALVEETNSKMMAFESAVEQRVQEAMGPHQAQFHEEQRRYSAQLERSLESLSEAREQRARLLELVAAKTQELEAISGGFHRTKNELQNIQAEIELLRRTHEDEIAAIQRAHAQQSTEDKRVLDAGWAALKVMRQELEESSSASSRMQLDASVSKVRQSFASEHDKLVADVARLQSQLSAAQLELKNCAYDRDSIKQQLESTQLQLKGSSEHQAQMQQVEASFKTMLASLDASSRNESQLRDIIQQQEEAALLSDSYISETESRLHESQERQLQSERTHQAVLKEMVVLRERLAQETATCCSFGEQILQLQSSNSQLQARLQTSDLSAHSWVQKLDSSSRTESELSICLQQQKEDAAASALTIKSFEGVVLDLKQQLRQKDATYEATIKEAVALRERLSQEASASRAARDLMSQTMQQCADDRIAGQRLLVVAEELKSCKVRLEEESRARMAAQEELALLASHSVGSRDQQIGDVMQAAHSIIKSERERLEKGQAAEEARWLELQLELKNCKDELRVERETAARAIRDAAEHQDMLKQLRLQIGGK